MKISQSIITFLLFTILIAATPAVLQYTGNTTLLDHEFWTLFSFISVLTFLVLVMMLVTYQKKKEYFAQAFLGGTTLKILITMIFIFVLLRNNKVNKLIFMADFLYIYLLNTAFEVYILLRNLRHENLR
jgi:fucose 4-O-acetylase-like acetyltransferase